MIKPLFKAKVPPASLEKYHGKTVIIPTFAELDGKRTKISEEKITIEKIVGNLNTPHFYEINGCHLIGMLRFYAQMEKATDIPEEVFHHFETMEHYVEKVKDSANH